MSNQTRTEKLLLEAARRFNATLEYEELIEIVLNMVSNAVESEAALVFRVDHQRTNMRVRFMNCSGDHKVHIVEHELGKGVVGWVAKFKEPVILNDPKNDERFDASLWGNFNIDVHSLISVPLIGKGHMIGVIEAINKENGGFTDQDLDILTGLSHQIAVAIDNANLYRQTKKEALEKCLLYEIGKKLSGTLSLSEVLQEIVEALKQVIEFDAGGVFVINPDIDEIDSLFTVGYECCSNKDLHLKFGEGLVGHVAGTGKPIVVNNVDDNPHYIKLLPDTKSEMVVPIEASGKVIGVFNIETKKQNAFSDSDLALINTFAAQAAVSIERARLHEKMVSSNKIEQQLKIARDIQMSFLPKHSPLLQAYDISGENIPSGDVGGDYYDFIKIVDNQIGIAIGDVSGKGIPAALLMASFRASLIAEIRNNYSIRTICTKVNQLMCESMQPGNFVTAVYGVLDAKNHIFTFSNCGHNQPIMVRADDTVEYLAEGGQIFGVTPDALYEERPVYIGVGDIIILFTDGVSEVFNDKEEQFGEERIVEILKKYKDKSTTEIRDIIYDQVHKFAAEDHTFDDFTMIVLKRKS